MALPEISFVDYDAEAIKKSLVDIFESMTGRTLAPGSPEILFLYSLAAYIVNIYASIDYTGKQNLLQYAKGLFLDHLGELTGTERLNDTYARTTIRFSIPEPFGFDVKIPQFTRVTDAAAVVYFQTLAETEIVAGNLFVDTTAEAMTAGIIGNGFAIEQIDVLVDPLPYFPAVSNTTVSSGGGEVESDADYYARIKLTPESYSVAGPAGSYRFWARTADPRIINVSAISTDPGDVLFAVDEILLLAGVSVPVRDAVAAEISTLGVVKVYALLRDGELPTPEINQAIEAVLSDGVRPLTDKVIVENPEAIFYNIDLTYFIHEDDISQVASIQTAVEAAVDQYLLWQKGRLGRDINPDQLINGIISAGALKIDLLSPSFQELSDNQIAQDGTISVTYGGPMR